MSAATTGAAPAFAAAIADQAGAGREIEHALAGDGVRVVEHVARQRLAARPGEGPIGRRQAHGVEFFLGLLPDRHRLFGDVAAKSPARAGPA